MKNIKNYIFEFNNFKKPNFLKLKFLFLEEYKKIKKIVKKYNLNTICEDGNCPNINECWTRGTATFMILGSICTRNCFFCSVKTGKPLNYDLNESNRISNAIRIMNIQHIVITSVNRDELKDKGSRIWNNTVIEIKIKCPFVTIETLIPDVQSCWNSLYKIINSHQEIVSYNMETVERLYSTIMPQSKYLRNLEQIRRIKLCNKITKSGIILGLGEKDIEVYNLIEDLVESGLDILTIGQYLRPTNLHVEVFKYFNLKRFNIFKEKGLKIGLKCIESGPLVRSSYYSEKHININ